MQSPPPPRAGVAERLDAGAYLEQEPTCTGAEAEAWRGGRGTGGQDDA